MSNRNRIVPIRGSGEGYETEIVNDLDDSAARKRLAVRSRTSIVAGTVNAAEPPKIKSDPKPASKRAAGNADVSEKMYVRPLVRPLARQQNDLNDLICQGYNPDVILRRARQETQRRFTFNPVYTPAPADDETSGKPERINVKVAKADLEMLSQQAGDLGTMPYTQLIFSQVQKIWVEELDKVISKLKEKSL